MNEGRVAAALWLLLAGPAAAQEAAPAARQAASSQAPAADPATLHIVYLSRAEDPAYRPVPAEDGVFRPPLPEPSPGADLAIRDTRATAHAAGVAFSLDRRVVAEGEAVAAGLPDLVASGAVAVVADLPPEDLVTLARAAPATLPIFNVRDPDDGLRRDFCGKGLFHVVPSTGMLTDALAQFAVSKNWRRVLVLSGPLPADKVLADAFTVSARKFGARVVGTKVFAYGNDPRKREQIDVALMTASDEYDIVFLADTAEDFGRYVPYQIAKPRPVMGTEGLRASAWLAVSERFGSPQVNHRFDRLAHRDMGEGDWATWAAVRSVVEAVIRTKARTAPEVERALAQDELPIDVSKGIQSSYRPWDHQFRQAIELHSADAVIAYAPLDGFLHQRTPLDTLGIDREESPCRPM